MTPVGNTDLQEPFSLRTATLSSIFFLRKKDVRIPFIVFLVRGQCGNAECQYSCKGRVEMRKYFLQGMERNAVMLF